MQSQQPERLEQIQNGDEKNQPQGAIECQEELYLLLDFKNWLKGGLKISESYTLVQMLAWDSLRHSLEFSDSTSDSLYCSL